MKLSVRFASGLVGCAALTACGTDVQYMPLNAAPHEMAARDPSSVELFTTGKPTKPYVEVGRIRSELASVASNSNADDLLQALRVEGGKRGCDAVIVAGTDKMASANAMGAYEGTLGYTGVCIVYE
jgi:hypothetical protein